MFATPMPVDSEVRQSVVLEFLSSFTPRRVVGMRKIRIGNQKDDGGYVMLDDFRGVVAAISGGIGDEVSWDLDIAGRGIDVYQFDHTVRGPPKTSSRFHFFKRAIGGQANENFESIHSIIEKLPPTNNGRVILKIDIEGAEWDAFDAASPEDFAKVSQLTGEFHGFFNLSKTVWRERVARIMAKLNSIFQVIHVHGNNWSTLHLHENVPFPDTIELSFANRSMYQFADTDEIFPTALDRPNDPRRPDFFLGSLRFGERAADPPMSEQVVERSYLHRLLKG